LGLKKEIWQSSAGGERVKTNVCTTNCRLAQAVAYILTKKLEEFVMICAKNLDQILGCHDTMTPPGSPPMVAQKLRSATSQFSGGTYTL